jgi:hypothetical protein
MLDPSANRTDSSKLRSENSSMSRPPTLRHTIRNRIATDQNNTHVQVWSDGLFSWCNGTRKYFQPVRSTL